MAKEFIPLTTTDTKDMRRALGLPIFKSLRYMKRVGEAWQEIPVISYEVVDIYMPSETYSILLTLKNNDTVQILQSYFSEMQKPSFIDDVKKQEELLSF